MKFYRLLSSQSDRVAFDEMATRHAQDAIGPLNQDDIDELNPVHYAIDHWIEGDLCESVDNEAEGASRWIDIYVNVIRSRQRLLGRERGLTARVSCSYDDYLV